MGFLELVKRIRRSRNAFAGPAIQTRREGIRRLKDIEEKI
jgi:hypothetical protein